MGFISVIFIENISREYAKMLAIRDQLHIHFPTNSLKSHDHRPFARDNKATVGNFISHYCLKISLQTSTSIMKHEHMKDVDNTHVFERVFKRNSVTDAQHRPYAAVNALLSVPQFTLWPFKGKVADHWCIMTTWYTSDIPGQAYHGKESLPNTKTISSWITAIKSKILLLYDWLHLYLGRVLTWVPVTQETETKL